MCRVIGFPAKNKSCHSDHIQRRIEGTIRLSIISPAVPSSSPYDKPCAELLVFQQKTNLATQITFSGGLRARYVCPSYHPRCPQARPTINRVQSYWFFTKNKSCHSDHIQRRIEGTTRSSIISPAVPSSSPYDLLLDSSEKSEQC